jgi:hypothetical protein
MYVEEDKMVKSQVHEPPLSYLQIYAPRVAVSASQESQAPYAEKAETTGR